VRDAAGHRYTFPDGFRLRAGKQAIIHTGLVASLILIVIGSIFQEEDPAITQSA
jgi:hypothetical protein